MFLDIIRNIHLGCEIVFEARCSILECHNLLCVIVISSLVVDQDRNVEVLPNKVSLVEVLAHVERKVIFADN
jgi:hypothetical protein